MGGLPADLTENLSRMASASDDFGWTHASRKHAKWLLNMPNNHHGFLTISENVRCTCTSLKEHVIFKEPVRWPYDSSCMKEDHTCPLRYTYVDCKSLMHTINI